MVFFNHATRQMTAKIVYYGPGLCGKTTNLNTIYGKTSQKSRGEMVSLNTETDRTLFFDLLPMDVGMVGGFKTKLQLYTVPGQVFYNSTRKLVLKGVDGIVFVVDSQVPMLEACRESWLNLEENMRELGLNLHDIPVVFQWNKRDLKNVLPVEELEAAFNARGVPSFQSVASDGTGVFETLRGITKLALSHIKTHVLGESPVAPAPAAPAQAPASARPPSADGALTLSDLPSVTDLLDMDRLTRGALEPRIAPEELAGVIERVVRDAEQLAGRRVELQLVPAVVMVDRSMVERIVENLLVNAVKHTPDDVTIRVRSAPVGDAVEIVVEDDGPGIPPELREALFRPFERGPSANAQSPGVGLGLSLVARFAELHGGRAWVEDAPSGGAAFHVLLASVGR